LAPITRSYIQSINEDDPVDIKPFELNANKMPRNLKENFAYFDLWKKDWHGANLSYEYHFWYHQYFDPSMLKGPRIINDDIKLYKANDVNGLIEDGSQRSFFPGGFAFYTYARTLFDTSLSYEEILEDYFSHAYGADWKKFLSYFERLGAALDQEYLEGEKSSNPQIGAYYRPEYLDNISEAEKILAEGEELVKSHYNSDFRVQTSSVRLMEKHIEYCRGFIDFFRYKAVGDDDKAREVFNAFCDSFGAHEAEIELCYDHLIFTSNLRRIIEMNPTQKPNEITQL
jgi:hypothetical protein